MRPILIAVALTLAACQPNGGAPSRVRGDQISPGEVEVAGFSHCDAARLELAAVVLDGPPKGAALEDVGDATAPGCTWVAVEGDARVRLNVYNSATTEDAGAVSHAVQFEALADAHAARSGAGVQIDGIGLRAARFGFSAAAPDIGVILIETGDAVLEFEGRAVSPAKLAIFARGVSENMAQPQG